MDLSVDECYRNVENQRKQGREDEVVIPKLCVGHYLERDDKHGGAGDGETKRETVPTKHVTIIPNEVHSKEDDEAVIDSVADPNDA